MFWFFLKNNSCRKFPLEQSEIENALGASDQTECISQSLMVIFNVAIFSIAILMCTIAKISLIHDRDLWGLKKNT